jgi:predicted dehydrogenase
MAAKVSLGIIGLGTIAQTQHLPNISELDDRYRIAAVADISARLVGAIAADLPWDVATSQDWRDICTNADVDAVLLLTPGGHEVMTEAALVAGKHVFAEKPLCLTVAAATRLNALARDRGLVLQVGYMKPYESALDEVGRRLDAVGDLRLVRHTVYHPEREPQLAHTTVLSFEDIDAGALGDAARHAEARTIEAIGEPPRQWRRLYRGVLQGSLIHTVSLIRLVFGDLPVISGSRLWPAAQFGPDVGFGPADTDPPSLQLTGMLGDETRVEMNWLWLPNYPIYREVLEIVGTAGSMDLDLPPPYVRERAAELTVRVGEGVDRRGGGTDSAFVHELVAFHDAIAEDKVLDDALGAAADTAWLQEALQALAADDGVVLGGEVEERRGTTGR